MIFERAKRDDISELCAMRLAYISEDSGELPADRLKTIADTLPAYLGKHLEKDLYAFVCREDGVIAGCCMLYVSEKPPGANFPTGRTGTVLNVYTMPDQRKKGIARRLMEMLISFSREQGLDYIELKATEAGYPLYKSLGFEDSVSHYHEMRFYCG